MMIGEFIRKEIMNQLIVQHVKHFVRRIQIAAPLNVKKIRQGFLIVVGGHLENVQQKLKKIQTMLHSLHATSNFVSTLMDMLVQYSDVKWLIVHFLVVKSNKLNVYLDTIEPIHDQVIRLTDPRQEVEPRESSKWLHKNCGSRLRFNKFVSIFQEVFESEAEEQLHPWIASLGFYKKVFLIII